MAKKDLFPDAYSGPNYESEGSGCSGHNNNDDMDSGGRRKWIKLSAGMHDGFGVPVHVVQMAKMSNVEKKKWLFRLRGELDQVRTLKRKIDVDNLPARGVAMSSSNDVYGMSGNGRKVAAPGKRADQKGNKARPGHRGSMGRVQSIIEPSMGAGTFTPILKKQCQDLLKKLMTHVHGWVFNKPVDIVALKLPDYFDVIKNPMDLGTIKGKLSSGKYSSPLEFAADVRLTFSNAMTYNPPGNDVHIMADVLNKFFELRWKPIEKKLPASGPQQPPVHEEIDLAKPIPSLKKRKITSIQQEPLPILEPVKLVMTSEEKHNLSRELEAHLGDLPDNIIDFLREHSSNGNDSAEDEIEIDIDDLKDETLFKLRKMLDDHVRELQSNAKAEPCVIELLHESGLSNSTMQLYRGNDPEDVDMGGNEPPVSSHTPVGQEKGINKKSEMGTTSRTSSDSNSRNASENGHNDDVKASSPLKVSQNDVAGADVEDKAGTSDLIDNQSVSGLDQVEHMSQQKPGSVESDSQKDDGDSTPNSSQLSPGKLYRAALLKNRFADTIFKAREKTLNQVEKGDPEKLRREKEELENQKRKEKARLQAAAEAAENARRRAEAEAKLEAKRKRDLEREAARQALLKIEKTVEIDETSRFIEDLEMLRSSNPDQLAISVDETSPDHGSLDALGSFNFGSSNPLEQLGLYMKRDEHEEDDGELELPSIVPSGMDVDVEEGEID
uniref:Transcription factor GTE8-like n=1 Tax=Tanacetum cinerariifolium TaxID=118510 RepID=A0A699GL98_TANCI|nr:hypothetical protein [Tanacetum cinerariifolium]GEW11897.1 hypothetical protein [Tanacetum cinerariifolium]